MLIRLWPPRAEDYERASGASLQIGRRTAGSGPQLFCYEGYVAMILYAGAIFLGAFLLFLVQPIIAKQILPWFGGSAAVWATCMVFFQVVLLAGYAYADLTTRRLTPKRQVALHVGLLAAEPPGAAHHAERGLEAPGRRESELAHPRPAGGHHRAAVSSAVDHQSAAAGVVRPSFSSHRALSPVRAVESGLAAGAAGIPGPDRTVGLDGDAVDDLVGALRAVRAAVRIRRHLQRAGERCPPPLPVRPRPLPARPRRAACNS